MGVADEVPGDLPSRVAASTAFGIVGPIATALLVGFALAATSTPAPGEGVDAFVLYIAAAVYLTGLIWDVFGIALNAAANRRHPETARNSSSCLFGLIPVGGGVVVFSALADGDGWIFDWRFVLVVLVALNIAELLLFSAISRPQPSAPPAP